MYIFPFLSEIISKNGTLLVEYKHYLSLLLWKTIQDLLTHLKHAHSTYFTSALTFISCVTNRDLTCVRDMYV